MSKLARARFVKNLKIAEETKRRDNLKRKEKERLEREHEIVAARAAEAAAEEAKMAELAAQIETEQASVAQKWSSWEAEQEAAESQDDGAQQRKAARKQRATARKARAAARAKKKASNTNPMAKPTPKPGGSDAATATAAKQVVEEAAAVVEEEDAELDALEANQRELEEHRVAFAAAQAAAAARATAEAAAAAGAAAAKQKYDAYIAAWSTAEAACTLPGWAVVESTSKKGKLYYYHEASGTTCWTPPTDVEDSAARADVDVLLRADADEAKVSWDACSPVEQLVVTAASDDYELLAALLAADATLHATSLDADGSTALHTAAHYGHVNTLRILLGVSTMIDEEAAAAAGDEAAGAGAGAIASASTPTSTLLAEELTGCCRCADAAGCTALHWACAANEYEACALLVALDSLCVDIVNDAGETALHAAAAHGCIDCLGLLLAAGADPNIANAAGQTVAHVFVAAAGGDAEDAEALAYIFGMGGDASALDGDGRAPLYYARCVSVSSFPFSRALSRERLSLSLPLSLSFFRGLSASTLFFVLTSFLPSSPSPFFFSSPLQLRRSRCVRCHLLAVDGPRHVARLCRGGRARRQRPAHCRVPKLNARHRSAHETRVGLRPNCTQRRWPHRARGR